MNNDEDLEFVVNGCGCVFVFDHLAQKISENCNLNIQGYLTLTDVDSTEDKEIIMGFNSGYGSLQYLNAYTYKGFALSGEFPKFLVDGILGMIIPSADIIVNP